MNKIVSARRLTSRHVEYVIEAPEVTLEAGPGQLVMVCLGEGKRPAPHAIADIDRVKGTITVVAAHDRHVPEDAPVSYAKVAEISGPLGRRSRTRTGGKVLFAAQGIGVAAMLPRLRAHKQEGCYTIAIAAFPSKEHVFWQDKIAPHCDELYVTTDDGSYGIKGAVKHTIRAVCEHNNDIEQTVLLGPIPMLKSAADATRRYEIPTIVSLTAVMDDDPAGGAAASSTYDGLRQPSFDWSSASDLDGHTVNFDDITRQLGIQQEK